MLEGPRANNYGGDGALTVICVQHELFAAYTVTHACLRDEGGGMFGTLVNMYFPAYDHTAVNVQHQIQPIELAAHRRRQKCDVPAPDLQRGMSHPGLGPRDAARGVCPAPPMPLAIFTQHAVEA